MNQSVSKIYYIHSNESKCFKNKTNELVVIITKLEKFIEEKNPLDEATLNRRMHSTIEIVSIPHKMCIMCMY